MLNLAGADVSHPGPGVENRPSVASLVWSWDTGGCRYSAVTRVQRPRSEVIEELKSMMEVCGAIVADAGSHTSANCRLLSEVFGRALEVICRKPLSFSATVFRKESSKQPQKQKFQQSKVCSF